MANIHTFLYIISSLYSYYVFSLNNLILIRENIYDKVKKDLFYP